PCTISSVIAVNIARFFGMGPMSYPVASFPEQNIQNFAILGGFALVCAVVGMVFIYSLRKSGQFFAERIENPYLRVISGGLLVIALTLMSGTRDFNGAGGEMIALSFTGKVVWYAFLVKIIFTAITMGSGFKGGEIVPSFFIGATLGNVFGQLTGISPSFCAAMGMICVFCSVVNCPMASVLMSIELFGGEGMLFFALGCGICFVASGYYSLYATQNFVYSKVPLKKTDDRSLSLKPRKWKELSVGKNEKK
ncbi:MAG: chloride channel protein, partial [Eubacterium sp.]|nr:chloride channel protein [Eubacterium sp.]